MIDLNAVQRMIDASESKLIIIGLIIAAPGFFVMMGRLFGWWQTRSQGKNSLATIHATSEAKLKELQEQFEADRKKAQEEIQRMKEQSASTRDQALLAILTQLTSVNERWPDITGEFTRQLSDAGKRNLELVEVLDKHVAGVTERNELYKEQLSAIQSHTDAIGLLVPSITKQLKDNDIEVVKAIRDIVNDGWQGIVNGYEVRMGGTNAILEGLSERLNKVDQTVHDLHTKTEALAEKTEELPDAVAAKTTERIAGQLQEISKTLATLGEVVLTIDHPVKAEESINA